MIIFSEPQARYYCSGFSSTVGDSEGSMKEFYSKNIKNSSQKRISEGTPLFNELRDCNLRDVERNLFFAASNYRRSLDLMIESSSPWCLVTIYYANFFSVKVKGKQSRISSLSFIIFFTEFFVV